MDDKIGLPLKDALDQPGIDLFSIPAIPDHSKLKRRGERADPLNMPGHFSDRFRMGIKSKEENRKEEDQPGSNISLLEIISQIFHNRHRV